MPPEPNRRRLHPATAGATRRAGRAMLAVSGVGVFVGLVATILGWVVVGNIIDSTSRTIGVSVDSLDAVDDTITLAAGVLDSTIATVDTVESTLDTLADSVDQGTDVVDSVTELSAAAGPALVEAEATLRELEQIGGTIDGILATLSNLPFGLDYDPDASFGSTMGDLADDIAPLTGAFGTTSENLDSFAGSSSELRADIEELAESVGDINDQLADSPDLVDQYRTNVATARGVALATQSDLDSTLTYTRLLIILLGVTFAAGQLVPFWYGRELLLSTEQSPGP